MIDILVMAAGESRRYGAAKQLADIGGTAMLRRVVLQALETGARVSVVVGANADAVSACVADLEITVVRNDRWSSGMGGSIATGVADIAGREPATSAILVTLADQPLVGSGDFRRMLAAHRAAPERIVAADHGNGLIGVPALFPPAFHDALRSLSGPSGARLLLERHAADIDGVVMPAARIDIDTPEDLARLAARRNGAP
jgi:molybdenum cofactor cytidylyltransferase